MDPLKAAAAAAFCLILFVLAYRLTRRLVDVAIAQGHAEERRRLAEEAAEAQGAAGAVPQASAISATAASLASNADQSSRSAIGAQRASTSSISIVHGAPVK